MKHATPHSLNNRKRIGLKIVLQSVFLLSTFTVCFAGCERVFAQDIVKTPEQESQKLTPSAEVEKIIRGGESHFYKIELKAGECARLIIRQKGIDLTITVKNPDEKIVKVVDRPNGSYGRETVTFTAEENGEFLIKISPLFSYLLPDRYSILLDGISAPTESDELRSRAEKLMTEGENLRVAGESNANSKMLAQAYEQFQSAAIIWQQLRDDYEQAVVSYGTGWTFIPQGKYDQATISFSKGLKIAQALGDEYAQTLNYAGIGWSEFYSGNFETATFNFNLVLELARQNNYRSQTARALFGLGNIAYMSENYTAALELLNECVKIRRDLRERTQENLSNITIAKVLIRQKRETEAIDLLNKSLAAFESLKNGKAKGEVLITLGWVFYSLGKDQEAVANFDKALQIRDGLGDQAGQAAALRGLISTHERTGEYLKAKTEFDRMFAALDSLRGESLNADTRMSFTASIQEYYEDGIELLMKMREQNPGAGYEREAFDLNEQSRSRILLDLIQEKQTDYGGKNNPELLAQKQEIERQLLTNLIIERESGTTGNKDQNLKAQRLKIQNLLFSLRETENKINEQKVNKGEQIKARSVPLSEIQKYLDDETVLLEFSLGKRESYLWMVARDSVRSFSLPARREIENLAIAVRDSLLLQKINASQGEKIFDQKSNDLSRILLAQVAPYLKKQRIIVVPQGALQYIPFSALPENGIPLIVNHEITSLQSASLLVFLQNKKLPVYKNQIAVFADPVFSADDERLKENRVRKNSSENDIQRLFTSRFEAQKISSFAPPGKSLIVLDAQASRENLMKADLSSYRILHFATHSIIDDERPELSAIMLSNYDERGQKITGLLRSAEIINLNINSEMVVLSGCRTGLGKDVRGEGLLNLSRSFMLAGTSRLLVSLWEVEDKATAEFMARFYEKHLKEKMTAAAALRAAKLDFMKDKRWRLPFYWSAFVLQGDWK